MALSDGDREFLDDWFTDLSKILKEIRDRMSPQVRALPGRAIALPPMPFPPPRLPDQPNADPPPFPPGIPPQCTGGE